MSKTAMLYVIDAIEAGAEIMSYTEGRTIEDYYLDSQMRAAVERKFEIVGEALRNVRRLDPALAAVIPALGEAVAFRNILIHGYATVRNDTVWSIVQEHLPGLLEHLEGIAASRTS